MGSEDTSGGLSLDERLERIEKDIERMSDKLDRLLLWVVAIVAGSAAGSEVLQALIGG